MDTKWRVTLTVAHREAMQIAIASTERESNEKICIQRSIKQDFLYEQLNAITNYAIHQVAGFHTREGKGGGLITATSRSPL